MTDEAIQQPYRADQRHLYNPGPCPHCGGTNVTVSWVNAGSLADRDQWLPGQKTCHNLQCSTNNGGVDPLADLR